MSIGIKIEGGAGNNLSGNLLIGHDDGISLRDSSDNILNNNIVISKSILEQFGQEFSDVARAVHQSQDIEARAALASVLADPRTSALGWSTLVQKFGPQIGRFSIVTLEGILSSAAWDALKAMLKAHGVAVF